METAMDTPARATKPAVMPPDEKPADAAPSHVICLSDGAGFLAGKVLAADAELLAALEKGDVSYRAATPRERSLGGFA
jgi:hypothetical protein